MYCRQVVLVAVGGCLLHALHTATLHWISRHAFLSRLPSWKRLLIAEEVVAVVNSLAVVLVGGWCVAMTSHDVINARWPMVNDWMWLLLTYFAYDLWAMFRIHEARHCQPGAATNVGVWRRVVAFSAAKCAIVAHHTLLSLLGAPVALYFRGQRGDFMIGCFFLLELSTPFVAARAVMAALEMKSTRLYRVNGCCMIISFFVCRVLMFPFMYWACAGTMRVPFMQVFARVPWYCHMGNALILSLQLYWLTAMLAGAWRMLARRDVTQEHRSR